MPAGSLRAAVFAALEIPVGAADASPFLWLSDRGLSLEKWQVAGFQMGGPPPQRMRGRGVPRTAFNKAFANVTGGEALTAHGYQIHGTVGKKVDEDMKFVTEDGKVAVFLDADDVEDCVETCQRSPELGGHDGVGFSQISSPAEMGIVSAPPEYVQECITFCEAALERPSCFPGSATVVVRDRGRVPLRDVSQGDAILAAELRGSEVSLRFERVQRWLHREEAGCFSFVRLRHSFGEVELSEEHLIFVRRWPGEDEDEGGSELATSSSSSLVPVLAKDVAIGDRLLCPWIDLTMAEPKVLSIDRIVRKGLFAPLVRSGAVIVDNTLCSCYALPLRLAASSSVQRLERCVPGGMHQLAHLVHRPLRLVLAMRRCDDSGERVSEEAPLDKQPQDAIHPYSWALYKVAMAVLA